MSLVAILIRRAKRLKTKGIYFLYRFLQALALPALLLYFVWRGLRSRAYWHSLFQRFGFLPRSLRQTGPGAIWLHAVSVGEVLACTELLRLLRASLPHTRLFVSTSTLAGHATATSKLDGLADGVFFAPTDYTFAVRRVLRTLKPSVVVVAETEIWPNLFRETKRTGAGLILVNGRVSDRALPRYRRYAWFFRAILPALDALHAQTADMAGRFFELGAAPGRTLAAGNFKFDFAAHPAASSAPVPQLLARLRPEQVWIAASTMPPAVASDPDEDDAVIAAFSRLSLRFPGLFLILVPRKPERFDSAAAKLAAAGIPFLRRTALDAPVAAPRALLLDSVGELGGLFAFADVVFMGGTLVSRGGHNVLEPALFSKPVVAGPSMENFSAIAGDFRAAQAWVEIGSAADLEPALARLLEDPAAAAALGRRALACAESRRGATARAAAEIVRLHRLGLPTYRPAQPWYALAALLARVWTWGSRRKQARDLARRRRAAVPAISVGNLTMGGTGKTPCVLRLAELFAARGLRPAILTRGYGRRSPEKCLALPAGANVPAERCGDEPLLFLRSGLAPVGIGADRFAVSCLLLDTFPVDLLLLDDGMQHLRLDRDAEVVLVDALSPFAGGSVFPLGRLREPLAGLARANLFLLTRSEYSDLAPAIEATLRCENPSAPIFHATVRPIAIVDQPTGARLPLEALRGHRVGAFCGLGNPQSFRSTLEEMGAPPVHWQEFDDHHHYRPQEVRRLVSVMRSAGATVLVTTGKDAVNFPAECLALLEGLPLYWLSVEMAVENEPEFLAAIDAALLVSASARPQLRC
jgi:3-deoxy-D-manno-octulosonic-acid transferase